MFYLWFYAIPAPVIDKVCCMYYIDTEVNCCKMMLWQMSWWTAEQVLCLLRSLTWKCRSWLQFGDNSGNLPPLLYLERSLLKGRPPSKVFWPSPPFTLLQIERGWASLRIEQWCANLQGLYVQQKPSWALIKYMYVTEFWFSFTSWGWELTCSKWRLLDHGVKLPWPQHATTKISSALKFNDHGLDQW